MYKRLVKKYEDEYAKLEAEVNELCNKLIDCKRTNRDINKWIGKIKKCISMETITREIIVELIESIGVSEAYMKNGKKCYDIDILYRFEKVE